MSTSEPAPPSRAVPIPPSTSTPVDDVVTHHEFVQEFSAESPYCGAMVTDDEGCGDTCGKHSDDPIHAAAQEPVRITFGDRGWWSVFHDGCGANSFSSGIVGPDGQDNHALPDGALLRAWKCHSCGVRFFAGLDNSHRVMVVPRAAGGAS